MKSILQQLLKEKRTLPNKVRVNEPFVPPATQMIHFIAFQYVYEFNTQQQISLESSTV